MRGRRRNPIVRNGLRERACNGPPCCRGCPSNGPYCVICLCIARESVDKTYTHTLNAHMGSAPHGDV
jgi:hypothetical protein